MSGPSSARNGPIFVFRALASPLDHRSRRDTCSPRDRRAVPNTRRGRHPTGVLSTALGRPRRPNGAEHVPYAPTGWREDAPLPRLRGAEPRVRWRPVGRPLAKKVLVELIMMRGRKCQKLAAIGGDRDDFWGVVASRPSAAFHSRIFEVCDAFLRHFRARLQRYIDFCAAVLLPIHRFVACWSRRSRI